jgi:hypothetical protein
MLIDGKGFEHEAENILLREEFASIDRHVMKYSIHKCEC